MWFIFTYFFWIEVCVILWVLLHVACILSLFCFSFLSWTQFLLFCLIINYFSRFIILDLMSHIFFYYSNKYQNDNNTSCTYLNSWFMWIICTSCKYWKSFTHGAHILFFDSNYKLNASWKIDGGVWYGILRSNKKFDGSYFLIRSFLVSDRECNSFLWGRSNRTKVQLRYPFI